MPLRVAFFRGQEPKIAFADILCWQFVVVDRRPGALDFARDDYEACKSIGQGLAEVVQAARSARFERGT